mmetsp:Transcript_30221/g.48798  ORF Transcript_30221/g.48798 Transcript_30221/m.48798 type:complete len:306 (-) Transcript_30221:368-1285(-)|eukprot:CAMPEP_0184644978 /NCGR_PEP_ID=MMETSP0308-20130426/1562_1 /TAXON_ID=38269 /ORGANISM="Gloeochaete witrockiana, Strain SAG 46.84" /LENGTH=305 /DNA_ID=CAMNT_0027073747 /DNA_START=175 /DNA_END=1092 /DNA_ORIENTATION=-
MSGREDDSLSGKDDPVSVRSFRETFNHASRVGGCVASFLTDDEAKALEWYRAQNGFRARGAVDAPFPALSEEEELTLSKFKALAKGLCENQDETNFCENNANMTRFLRARDWSEEKALIMLEKALGKRRRMKPETLRCETCINDPGCGDIRIIGFDRLHRPVSYSSFFRSPNRTTPSTILHTTCIMEKCSPLFHSGQPHQMVWITNFGGFSLYKDSNPRFAFEAADILLNQYPEMLGMFLVIDAPTIFMPVFNVVKPILPERTVAKIRFLSSRDEAVMRQGLMDLFDEEMADWIVNQVKEDKLSM